LGKHIASGSRRRRLTQATDDAYENLPPQAAHPTPQQIPQRSDAIIGACKKLPQVTLLFWVMKIAATTLGETGGDLLAQTLNIGYAISSLLFLALFLASLLTQLKAKTFHPALYWTVIVSTSTAGTTMSDFMNRSAGLGYAKGSLVLIACLASVFALWRRSGQTFSVQQINTFQGELLYWAAILLSNTLGTSTGDFLADSSGLGFAGGALVISAVMVLILAAHYLTPISGTVLFWMAFVLTRPLGATVGDFFTKPYAKGGLNMGTIGSSAALAAILMALIGYTLIKQRRLAESSGPTLDPIGSAKQTV
jgi:uncharacterized membrane-anchored protein